MRSLAMTKYRGLYSLADVLGTWLVVFYATPVESCQAREASEPALGSILSHTHRNTLVLRELCQGDLAHRWIPF